MFRRRTIQPPPSTPNFSQHISMFKQSLEPDYDRRRKNILYWTKFFTFGTLVSCIVLIKEFRSYNKSCGGEIISLYGKPKVFKTCGMLSVLGGLLFTIAMYPVGKITIPSFESKADDDDGSIRLKKTVTLPPETQTLLQAEIKSVCQFAEIEDDYSALINNDIAQAIKVLQKIDKYVSKNNANNILGFLRAFEVIDESNLLGVVKTHKPCEAIRLIAEYLDVPITFIPEPKPMPMTRPSLTRS